MFRKGEQERRKASSTGVAVRGVVTLYECKNYKDKDEDKARGQQGTQTAVCSVNGRSN